MDVCCLNRPFDDLSQDRIYLEAEAVLSIISHCEKGQWILFCSKVIDSELSQISDLDKLHRVQTLYSVATEECELTNEVIERALILQKGGIKPFDSLHIAIAEANDIDAFLTVDDKLLNAATRLKLRVRVENPVIWLMEVLRGEQ